MGFVLSIFERLSVKAIFEGSVQLAELLQERNCGMLQCMWTLHWGCGKRPGVRCTVKV